MGEKELDDYSCADYFEIDFQSEVRNEYDNGAIRSISGGTLNYGIIGNNVNAEINHRLKTKHPECISINGDVRIYIESANSFAYPDGMVICGKIETHEKDAHSIINPKLIIEVLSKSTESYDRGINFINIVPLILSATTF